MHEWAHACTCYMCVADMWCVIEHIQAYLVTCPSETVLCHASPLKFLQEWSHSTVHWMFTPTEASLHYLHSRWLHTEAPAWPLSCTGCVLWMYCINFCLQDVGATLSDSAPATPCCAIIGKSKMSAALFTWDEVCNCICWLSYFAPSDLVWLCEL